MSATEQAIKLKLLSLSLYSKSFKKMKADMDKETLEKNLIYHYGTLFAKKGYFKRTARLFSRRYGIIDLHQCSDKNYQALKTRLKNLSSPMSTLMHSFLGEAKRDELTGLTKEEKILFERLFNGPWWLSHRTNEEAFKEIMESLPPQLLSGIELTHQRLEKGIDKSGISYTQFEDEATDGIFFTISPGETTGHSFIGDYVIKIDLNKVEQVKITGLFTSGCANTFNRSQFSTTEKCDNISTVYGTPFYVTSEVKYHAEQGMLRTRTYCFDCDGETIKHTVSKTDEIYTASIIKALCYTVIERIRQLGKNSWQSIYRDIDSMTLEALQELASTLLSPMIVEAHLPRALQIKSPTGEGILGITVECPKKIEKKTEDLFSKIIQKSYAGDIDWLQQQPEIFLFSAFSKMQDGNFYDVLSAAILGGHLTLVEYLLKSGAAINGEIGNSSIDNLIHYDKEELIIHILLGLIGLKQTTPNFYSQEGRIKDLELNSIAPHLDKEQKATFVLEILTRLMPGTKGKANPNIYYPIWKSYSNVRFNFPELNNNLFPENCIEFEAIKILKNKLPKLPAFSRADKTITCVLLGKSDKTNEPWCLFEYGQDSFHRSLRINKKKMELLKIFVDETWSEEECCGRIVSEHYGIPPISVKLQRTFIYPLETKHEAYIINIVDPNENKRLENQFQEQIVPIETLENAIGSNKITPSNDYTIDKKIISAESMDCINMFLKMNPRMSPFHNTGGK